MLSAKDFTEDGRVLGILEEIREKCSGKEFSDIVDDAGNQYVDIVMEGGGVLGIALVGYTFALEQAGVRFLGIGGTSAGSINALLLASVGPKAVAKSETVVELIANLEMIEFVDGPPPSRKLLRAALGEAGRFRLWMASVQCYAHVRRKLGLNPGKAFHAWLTRTLASHGITTNAQLQELMKVMPAGLRHRDGTVLESQVLPQLALVAADVSTETKVHFPQMADLYWKDPANVNPADFVRASMSIPYFFEPYKVENIPNDLAAKERWRKLVGFDQPLPPDCFFMDGGIMSNFPIDLFHRPLNVPNAPTFGARLGVGKRKAHSLSTLGVLGGAMFNAARHCLDYDFFIKNPDYKQLVACIDTGDHDWLDFELKPDERVDLFIRGVRAARDFLIAFDWNKYKETRRSMRQAFERAEGQDCQARLANPEPPLSALRTTAGR